ncbi:MAG: hypothetical protein ACLQLG_16705, partial [Thermoguttaceae bacterium]
DMPAHSKRFSNANLPAASEQAITRDQFGTYCFNTQLLAESLRIAGKTLTRRRVPLLACPAVPIGAY